MFNIYLTKDVVEDNFTEGKIGKMYTTMYNSKIGTVNTINDCIKKICEFLDCEEKELEPDYENNVLMYSRLETNSGDKATESEIYRWRENKCQLFAAYFSFTITEENEIKLNEHFN